MSGKRPPPAAASRQMSPAWICSGASRTAVGRLHVTSATRTGANPWRLGKTTAMAEYQLYCFAQSGNAYRVALMLNLIGADWEPVWVDFFGAMVQRTPEFRMD